MDEKIKTKDCRRILGHSSYHSSICGGLSMLMHAASTGSDVEMHAVYINFPVTISYGN
jgi:hypothetical protein